MTPEEVLENFKESCKKLNIEIINESWIKAWLKDMLSKVEEE